MARVIKSAKTRKTEILNAAQTLFATMGYQLTTIQAIIGKVGISKGAFYHHFASKSDLLDELLAELMSVAIELVTPVIEDKSLSAIEKFVRFFEKINEWKTQLKGLGKIGKAMQDEQNAVLLKRQRERSINEFSPLLEKIVHQGITEKSFKVSSPKEASIICLYILEAYSRSFLKETDLAKNNKELHSTLTAVSIAYTEAIERILGAPKNSITLVDPKSLKLYIKIVREMQSASSTSRS
jgi:AcrR family transcriptional regulator